jgi:hypothetical protein
VNEKRGATKYLSLSTTLNSQTSTFNKTTSYNNCCWLLQTNTVCITSLNLPQTKQN